MGPFQHGGRFLEASNPTAFPQWENRGAQESSLGAPCWKMGLLSCRAHCLQMLMGAPCAPSREPGLQK